MAFAESLFPLVCSAWAQGGRSFFTTVVRTYGGNEYRNAAWAQPLGEWEIRDAFMSTSNRNATLAVAALRNFMMAAMGQLDGFRFRDPQDNTDEGSGVFQHISGSTWQCYKNYTVGSLTFAQIIQKPVNPIVITGGSGWSVDYTTGIATGTGTPTAWTGTFDIPVRFAEDVMKLGLDFTSGALWDWQSLKLIEIRDIS